MKKFKLSLLFGTTCFALPLMALAAPMASCAPDNTSAPVQTVEVTQPVEVSQPVIVAQPSVAVQPTQTSQIVEAQTPVRVAASQAPVQVAAAPTPTSQWNNLLSKYVAPLDANGIARFNYGALRTNAADYRVLTDYIAYLGRIDPNALSDREAIAYWANLYNVVTVDLIVQNYPLKSIKKAKTYNGSKVGGFLGPWKKVETRVNGQTVKLDAIEHEILRVRYPSPHVHYMVNCASIGCPNLKDGVWRAETLEQDREAAARAFINSPRGVRITPKGLVVSSIFNWFKDDFGGSNDRVVAHLRQFAGPELAAAIDAGAQIVGHDYDWSLNE